MPSSKPRPFEPLRKGRVALHGLQLAMRDKAVAYKLVLSLLVIGFNITQRNWIEDCVLLLATALVLSAELINTAIEELCDYVQPEHAPQIGATKDIAAAAVALCSLAWVGVMLFETARLLNVVPL
ncbi:MAG: diacylglycerol kinase [Vulcanococcus sp.]|jgi:diacylglycerol kinase (ATP)